MVYPADRSSDRPDLLGKLNDEYPERQYHFCIPDRDHYDHYDLGIYEGREEVFGGEGKEGGAVDRRQATMKNKTYKGWLGQHKGMLAEPVVYDKKNDSLQKPSGYDDHHPRRCSW